MAKQNNAAVEDRMPRTPGEPSPVEGPPDALDTPQSDSDIGPSEVGPAEIAISTSTLGPYETRYRTSRSYTRERRIDRR